MAWERNGFDGKANAWLANSSHDETKPNAEPAKFLDKVVSRCKLAAKELHRNSKEKHTEHIRDCLMGTLGAAKSKCMQKLSNT